MSKFTPATRYGIVARVATGVSLPDSARACDLHPDTLKTWLQRGRREQDTEYADLAAAIEAAQALAAVPDTPMDADELAHEISRAVRRGSVAAMRLRWYRLRGKAPAEDEPDEEDLGFGALDELAQQRAYLARADTAARRGTVSG